MKLHKLTELSLLTAVALIIFVVELHFPDILPLPGVKLGLANIITVFAVFRYRPHETFLLVASRVLLGTFFSGNPSALLYSAAGALLCLAGMLALRPLLSVRYLWLCSVIGAILHNTGQIAAACAVTGSFSVLSYLPFLLLTGSIAGLFTGLCAQAVTKRLDRMQR